MALVTVCIPAFRSAGFIGQTLASVQDQVFTEYEVLLALEPDGVGDTLEACRPFLDDERFSRYIEHRHERALPRWSSATAPTSLRGKRFSALCPGTGYTEG